MGARSYPAGPRAYVDLDGVLADFDGFARQMGADPAEAKLGAGWYARLPRMPGAIAGLQSLRRAGFDVWILSKIPRKNPYAATEKLLWVEEHLGGIVGEQVILSPDKGALGKHGDILIDDRPDWANAAQFGGRVIRFTSWDQALREAIPNPINQSDEE